MVKENRYEMKIASIYNWTILGYLILVTILTFNSNIAYGNGLGDVLFLFVLVTLTISQLIITLVIIKKQKGRFKPRAFYLLGTAFLLAALLLTFQFTIGRGSEYSWNGNIFYRSPFRNLF